MLSLSFVVNDVSEIEKCWYGHYHQFLFFRGC